jgi:outer membrane protein TolC
MNYGDKSMDSLLIIIKKTKKNQAKMKKSNLLILILFLLQSSVGQSQNAPTTGLKLDEFLQLVKKNHPLAKQSNLVVLSSYANTLKSRGNFDPKLFYDFQNKFYETKNYYALENGGFTIPTCFGIDIKAGYTQNEGIYLNPENSTPSNGLLYSQISIPVLQGLIIDERRSILKQAKLFENLSEYEKINILNDLISKAAKVYWDWNLSYNNLLVYKNSVQLSSERLSAIRMGTKLGDRPSIDTVEANIQLQDRILNYEQSKMEYQIKSLLLSNFLWLENETPIEITEKVTPAIGPENSNLFLKVENQTLIIDSLIGAHPMVKIYDLKSQQLQIEKKYKQDKLKPVLDLVYNPLFKPANINNQFINYKWGVSFNVPILLRKERGDLQLAKIKIENNNFETIYKKNELVNKLKSAFAEYMNYKKQLTICRQNLLNYEQLLLSEKKLFLGGESSLFMVNSREMSYINAQIKLNDLLNKSNKAEIEVEYSTGLLYLNY